MKKAFCLLLAVFLSLAFSCLAEEDSAFSGFVMSGGGEKDALDIEAGSITTAENSRSYEDLAVTGPYVWCVMDGFVRCYDVRTKQKAAELALSSLYPEKEDYLALSSCGDVLTLCAVTNAGPDCRVSLYELALKDGSIVSLQVMDATEKLAFLFDQKTTWMEVDLTACAGGLLITALNMEKVYQLYLYDPVPQMISELGTLPFNSFTGVFPFKDGLLFSGTSADNLDQEELTFMSLPGGERQSLGTFQPGAVYRLSCMALNETEQTLYYFADSVGYRFRIGTNTDPEPFCAAPGSTAWLRYGRVSEGWYVFLDEEGNLLYQDIAAAMETSKLHILDLTGADLSSLVQVFASENPEYLAVINEGDNPNDVLTAMLNQSSDYDAYIINLGSGLYQALYNKGYLGNLGESETLKAASDAFPDRILSRIRMDGKLTAFPIGVQNSVLLLDVTGISALTGLSREEIPTDWNSFLKLLGQIGEDGLLDGSGRCLFESGLSADSFRIDLLSMILQDAMLWLNEDEARLSTLPPVLTPILQTLEETDWLKLGLLEDDDDEDDPLDSEIPSLLDWASPEIAVMSLRDGTEYWPLSLAPGEDRLVPQDVYVIVLNPWSEHSSGIARFTETLYREMDVITRMELDPSLNDPVKRDHYEEEIETIQALIPVYEQTITNAPSEEEAEELQAELDEMLLYLDQYEKNGVWLVNDESIAQYRSLENLFAIHGDEFWADESQSTTFLQYVDRLIGPDQFVRQLVSTLQMARLEAE